MPATYFSLLLLITTCTKSKCLEDIFNLDADSILESEIGDIYKARAHLNSLKDEALKADQKLKFINITETANDTTTTTERILATIPAELVKKVREETLADFKKRHMLRKIEKVLNDDLKITPDLIGYESDFTLLTRRFDRLVSKFDNETKHESRRELYLSGDDQPRIYKQKKRTIGLQEQFVYQTRYRLPYAQLLRNKYKHTFKYKQGFLFALLRNLKNLQKWVYWALAEWTTGVSTIYFHLKLFQKIVRLDVDIKNLMALIRYTEYKKNLAYNPKFYDYGL